MAKSKLKIEKNFNVDGMNKVLKGLNQKFYTKVGIMGDKTSRGESVTNAELGIIHEFGSFTKGIEARSFLRMPLVEKRKQLVAFIAKQRKKLEAGLLKGGIKTLFEMIGVKAEEIVQNGFETGGFGRWKKPKSRPGGSPLIDTGQLRRSITSKVVKGNG